MYYLVIKKLSMSRCISKSQSNNFIAGGTYNCNLNLGMTSNASPITGLQIKCSGGSGNPKNAQVWSDAVTIKNNGHIKIEAI